MLRWLIEPNASSDSPLSPWERAGVMGGRWASLALNPTGKGAWQDYSFRPSRSTSCSQRSRCSSSAARTGEYS